MFRKNDQHLQWPLLSSIDSLPKKRQARLEASWAGTFYLSRSRGVRARYIRSRTALTSNCQCPSIVRMYPVN
jgi:hypothetical protein